MSVEPDRARSRVSFRRLANLGDEARLRALFRLSLLFKGGLSLLEIVGGAVAYFVSQSWLVHAVVAVTQEELTEDPNDYQLFRFRVTHSPWLLALTVVDIVVIWLTWHEYRYLRHPGA